MTIMNNNVEPVYSTWPCSKCKPLKTRSIEDSKKQMSCDAPGLGLTCSHSGVSLGEVHHIRSEKETCPRCKAQLFLCNCCNLGSGNRDKTQLIREGDISMIS